MEGLSEALREWLHQTRQRENELLESITKLSDYETAEAAKDLFAPDKHAYTFDGYLCQLEKLQTVLAAGVPPVEALEAVDSCADAQTIISYYRGGRA